MSKVKKTAKKLATSLRKAKKMFSELDRESIASIYLRGDGIEIGALHNPLPTPSEAKVKYVDIVSTQELKEVYPDRQGEFVEVDIISDGQTLKKVADKSQDFVIANHILEHFGDPIKAITNWMRVLKNDGVLYMVIPDMRYTFDKNRPLTTVERLEEINREGFDKYKEEILREWLLNFKKISDETEIEAKIKSDEFAGEVHYHVWRQEEMFELLLTLKKKYRLKFEVEMTYKREDEMIFVLRKK